MDREGIISKLHTKALGRELEFFDCIDSTNSYLKRQREKKLPHGTVVLADCQTGGRGRSGRSFSSPAGKGIYCSVLLRPEVKPEQALDLTSCAAVALCDGIERVTGMRPQIKWPNDLVMGGRKVCGILCEMSIAPDGCLEYVIIGFGLNVRQTREDWQEDLKVIAGSVEEAAAVPVSRNELAAAILDALEEVYHNWALCKQENIAAQYGKDCLTVGKEVRLLRQGREETAFAEGIDSHFGLIVRHPDGRRETVTSGEVSVRGLYGYI